MSPDPDEAVSDAHQLRHDLLSSLTIVSGQTQLLQRQLQQLGLAGRLWSGTREDHGAAGAHRSVRHRDRGTCQPPAVPPCLHAARAGPGSRRSGVLDSRSTRDSGRSRSSPESRQHRIQVERLGQVAVLSVAGCLRLGSLEEPGIR